MHSVDMMAAVQFDCKVFHTHIHTLTYIKCCMAFSKVAKKKKTIYFSNIVVAVIAANCLTIQYLMVK